MRLAGRWVVASAVWVMLHAVSCDSLAATSPFARDEAATAMQMTINKIALERDADAQWCPAARALAKARSRQWGTERLSPQVRRTSEE